MPIKRTAPAVPSSNELLTYGCKTDPAYVRQILGDKAQLFYDQWAFAHRVPIDAGAFPRPVLFRRIADVLAPKYFEWHAWTDRIVDAGCHEQWIGLAGCSGSAKTHNVTGFACLWWLCDPANSSVIFCSTTSKALRKRSWAQVQAIYSGIPGPRFGNFVDSRMMWQVKKGDDKHAIMGIAVEEGETMKVADNIKGVHTKRQMIVITEATAVPHAIMEAATNLYSYPEQAGGEFIMILEANPRSWTDEFGKFVEPDKGINSVNVETQEWETKPQINGRKGICIRFDIEKSPNLDVPEDKPVSKHLPTHGRLRNVEKATGYKDSPSYFSNERGFPPPEGLNKNVFSLVSIEAHGGYDRHIFTGEKFQIIGALDPARTGDRPTLRFAALGEIETGDMGLEWMAPIILKINSKDSNPIDYQLLEQVQRECEKVKYRGTIVSCSPANLGIDATGGGADLCDIFNRMWSFDIIRIGFGEAASSDVVSPEDVRPANTVYRNRRAEMYFRTRNGIDTGQIKGIDRETATEMCTLTYDDSKPPFRNIISKEDYKLEFKISPDLTDSGVILSEVARRKGFKLARLGNTKKRSVHWEEVAEQAQKVYQEVQYESESHYQADYEPV